MRHTFHIILLLCSISLSAQQSNTAKRMQALGFVNIADHTEILRD